MQNARHLDVKAGVAVLILLLLVAAPGRAAVPPPTVNYQGVLRSASDAPLSGTYDMLFSFYDAAAGGNQIMTDQHAAATLNAVTVTGGLFNVALGAGTVADGTGAGTYTSLADVFRDYGAVYLEIRVGAETLSPRTLVRSAAYALNATNLGGRAASAYLDTSTDQEKDAPLHIVAPLGVDALQLNGGIHSVGGNSGAGGSVGGYFANFDGSDWCVVGNVGGIGEQCSGTTEAALFTSADGHTFVSIGQPGGTGIYAFAPGAGGQFSDYDTGATFYAGYDRTGGYGLAPPALNGQAGYFQNYANTAFGVLGMDTGSPYSTGYAFGVKGVIKGNSFTESWAGDMFDVDKGIFARLSYHNGATTASISGNAAKSFVQNHPYDASKTLSYASLEGDEVGTYTRGTGRLVHGEARIPLGETFQWVTNPDVGLTAQVTAHGSASELYVASVSTTDLVVRSESGDPDAAFDYVVQGLRVGFEEFPTVSDRGADAKLPAVSKADELLGKRPDLERFTALFRFRGMGASAGMGPQKDDMARARELRKAIGEYDKDRDAPVIPAGAKPPAPPSAPPAGAPVAGAAMLRPPGAPTTPATPPIVPAGTAPLEGAPFPPNTAAVPVSEPVAAGDVVAVGLGGGAIRPAIEANDPRVIGIVAGEADRTWSGMAPLALPGTIVACHVDATLRAIGVGDLLVASPLAGYAMPAGESPAPGTIVAKALEPLEGRTGTIRVLVMSR